MNTLLIIGKSSLIIFMLLNIMAAFALNKRRITFILEIWKRFRVGMFFEVMGILILVMSSIILMMAYVPYFKYGWFNFISEAGGNILFSPILDLSFSANIILRSFVPIFFLLMILAVPFFVEMEEEIFRKGHVTWKEITRQSIFFGLTHLIVGIPIAAGIALCIPGFFLGYKYRHTYLKKRIVLEEKEAIQEALYMCTTYHAMIDTVLMVYIIIMTLC